MQETLHAQTTAKLADAATPHAQSMAANRERSEQMQSWLRRAGELVMPGPMCTEKIRAIIKKQTTFAVRQSTDHALAIAHTYTHIPHPHPHPTPKPTSQPPASPNALPLPNRRTTTVAHE